MGVGGVEQFETEVFDLGLNQSQIDYVKHFVKKHEGAGLYCWWSGGYLKRKQYFLSFYFKTVFNKNHSKRMNHHYSKEYGNNNTNNCLKVMILFCIHSYTLILWTCQYTLSFVDSYFAEWKMSR